MRLVFARVYYTARPDAVTRVMTDLGEELIKRGDSVTVLSVPGSGSLSPLLPETHVTRLKGPRKSRAGRAVHQAWYLMSAGAWLVVNRRSYDAVITVDSPVGLGRVAGLSGRITGRPNVMWVMDLFYRQRLVLGPKRWSSQVLARIEEWSLRGAKGVVVLGECMKVLVDTKLKDSTSQVIPLWPAPGSVMEDDQQLVGASETVLYSGFASAKNPLTWLADLGMENTPDAHILVQGSGDEIDRLRVSLESRVSGQIRVGQAQSDTDYRRSAHDARLHLVTLSAAALGTCVPSKAYTAMGIGRPVVFVGPAECQVARDVLEAGGGIVIGEAELASFEDRVLTALRDVDWLRSAGMRARKFVNEKRTAEAAATQWQSFLRSLL